MDCLDGTVLARQNHFECKVAASRRDGLRTRPFLRVTAAPLAGRESKSSALRPLPQKELRKRCYFGAAAG